MARAHVKITSTDFQGTRLEVDGMDLSKAVIRDGFSVTGSGSAEDPFVVSMKIATGTLEADLPEAVIRAVRASEDGDDVFEDQAKRLERTLAETNHKLATLDKAIVSIEKTIVRGARNGRAR